MSKAKQKLQYTYDHKNERFHFFASSIAEWSVNKNIDDLIKHMVKAGFPFVVWYVPIPVTAETASECRNMLGTGMHQIGSARALLRLLDSGTNARRTDCHSRHRVLTGEQSVDVWAELK